jgi:3-hydroxyisobutyrate dehydrogenase
MTCLPNPAIAEEVFRDLVNYSQTPRPDRLVIDYSTIDSITSQRIFATLGKAKFGTFVDAPMSGGVVGAEAATLTFMVGGTEETFSRVKPILEMVGKSVVHCGEQGTGLTAKLANNYLLAINNLGTAEAMNFGIKAGLDPRTIAGIINSSTGRNWSSEINNPVPGVVNTAPASRQYQGGFATRLMNKDLNLAIKAAEQVHAPLPLSKAASGIYGGLTDNQSYAGLDLSVVYDYLHSDERART